MMELGANILLSYVALVITTYVFRGRFKSTLVYTLFWYTFYSIPCVYYAVTFETSVLAALPVFSAVLLLLTHLRGIYKKSSMVTVLIPLPQVVALVYLVLVHQL